MATETTHNPPQAVPQHPAPAGAPPQRPVGNGHGPAAPWSAKTQGGHQAPPPAAVDSHGDHDEIGLPPTPPRPHFLLLVFALLAAAGVFAGAFFFGWLPMLQRDKQLDATANKVKNSLPRVTLANPRRADAITHALLPGDVQALEETTIYARTNGYLKRWLFDIGDEVKVGQLLAEIETPEIDDELNQAKATLGQLKATQVTAEANDNLARTTLRRYEALALTKSVSQQELDERRAAAETSASAVTAAKANVVAGVASVQRLTTLVSFQRVYAPFDGTVTARSVEIGQLITSGNGTNQALFHIAKTDPVRVFVDVPQIYSVGVRPGMKAAIIVREMPNRQFTGKVTRSARAIDPQTRTLLTEIQVPNPERLLLPHAYVQVKLDLAREHPPLLIPASALIFNADGNTVAVVDENRKVHFQPVTVEGDFGANVGVAKGLSIDDQVIVNPGQRLSEGGAVTVDEPAKDKAEASAPAK